MHTNWRPVGTDWIIGNVDVELARTSDRRLISYLDTPQNRSVVVNV